MQAFIVVTVILHVLLGVFWAGTTFATAHDPSIATPKFVRAQLAAAVLAIVAGAILWGLVHLPEALLGTHILGIGALCAIIAAIAQGVVARRPPSGQAMVQRLAALLLAVAVVSMVIGRYL